MNSISKFKADFGDVLDKASFQVLEDSAKRLILNNGQRLF